MGRALCSACLVVGAYGLVMTGHVSLAVFGVFASAVVGGGFLRTWLGGDRRATAMAQLIVAMVVALVSVGALVPIPTVSDGSAQSWRFIGHLMLIPAAMLAVDLTTRSARGMTVFSGLVLLAAAGSFPGSRSLGPLLVVYAAVAVAALAELEADASADTAVLAPSPTAARRSRARSRRRSAAVLAFIVVLIPVVLAVRPSPPTPSSSDGDRNSNSSPQRYGGFSDTLDTSDRFQLSDEVVLRVRASAPEFWRGTTYDTWDSRSWTRSAGRPVQRVRTFGSLVIDPQVSAALDEGVDADDGGGVAFPQTFTVEMPGTDVIFGAYRVSQVQMSPTVALFYDDGTIRRQEPLGEGAVYSVSSRRAVVTAEALRTHDPQSEHLPASFTSRYLQLPHVPDRVTALAAKLAAGQQSTYEVIRSMEEWLGRNTTYTLDIPPLPSGVDAVEQYLFVDRRGFCEQIASSLAVMLRSQGIPARVATGYVAGTYDSLSGEYVVRASDAHAWVEVFFPGIGWQAFDPTANVPLSGEFDSSFFGRLKRSAGALTWVLAAAAAMALIVAAAWMVRRLIRRGRRPAEPWAVTAVRRLVREGTRRGRPRAPNESVRRYLGALRDGPLPDRRLDAVAVALEDSLYGPSLGGDTTSSAGWVDSVTDEVCGANPAPPWWRRVIGSGAPPVRSR